MSEDIRLETNFEHYISRKLQELSDTGDWQVSQNDDGFDPNTGLVMDDFVAYINAASPQKIEKCRRISAQIQKVVFSTTYFG